MNGYKKWLTPDFREKLKRISIVRGERLRYFGIRPCPDMYVPDNIIGCDLSTDTSRTYCYLTYIDTNDRLWIFDRFPYPRYFFPKPLPIELKGVAV